MIAPTGIAKLDELLGGGLSAGELMLFWSGPGIDSSPFLYTIINAALERKEKVVYFTQNKGEAAVRREIERYGFSTENLLFIDGYSGLINQPSSARYVVKRAKDPKDITKTLERAMEAGPSLVAFDSLSSLVDVCGEKALEEVEKWKRLLEEKGAAAVFLFTEWPYNEKLLEMVGETADTIVRLGAVEKEVIHQRFFTVVKRDGSWVDRAGVPFEIASPGGLRIRLPKIVVTGPEGSGKSTFIRSASNYFVGAERAGTTVGIDYGKVDYHGFRVSLFGTPSHKRFDAILPVVGAGAMGAIVLVDATRPETLPHADIFIEKAGLEAVPRIVVSNHTGLPGALKPEKIRKKMGLKGDTPLIALTEREKKGGEPAAMETKEIHKVLDALFEQVV